MKTLQLLAAALVCALAFTSALAADPAKKPNAVLMLSDNVGYGDIGAFQGGAIRGVPTPNIDRLAAAGLTMKMTAETPGQITTPDKVETPAGAFEFFDGVPNKMTIDGVSDYVARARAVEVFINMIPAVSMVNIRRGQRDMGAAGPDKGKGGKYLVLPPGYKGDVPEGYFVVKSRTYGVWNMMRGYVRDSVKKAADNIKNNLKVYPLAKKDNPPKMEFINMTGREGYNTVPPNDFSFYEDLNTLIQEEPLDFLDPETRGQIASIGIVKDKLFNPDARMRRLLTEAVAIGNAYARANTIVPRDPGHRYYPDTGSEWVMAFADNDTYFLKDGARRFDSRLWMHYNAIAVTPAMALTKPGAGSQYAIAGLDSKHQALDGAKTYKLHLPPNVPVKDNWSVIIYDTQTRCMLQTDQQYAGINSLGKGLKKNKDGSFDIYFAPKAPKGQENNWIQTIPGKSWFIILRAYGPLGPWIDRTWRPGEIELVN